VIVNDAVVVDKKNFLHKISSLRQRQPAGKSLYLACTDVGEKTACLQRSRFCTSDPVHIQRLFHSWAACKPLFAGKTGFRQGCRTWPRSLSRTSRIRGDAGTASCIARHVPSALQGSGSLLPGPVLPGQANLHPSDRRRKVFQQAVAYPSVSIVVTERIFVTSCQTFQQLRA